MIPKSGYRFSEKDHASTRSAARLPTFHDHRITKFFTAFTENLPDGTFPRAAAFIQATANNQNGG
jgi:hypothetical protein